jgi:hypothetical protein
MQFDRLNAIRECDATKWIYEYKVKANGARFSVVVKALCYKPGGRGLETQLSKLIYFSILLILPAALGPGIHSASNRNDYQKQKNNVSGE